jgi:hypothetical protein
MEDNSQKICEMLDACRPGRGDEQAAEMAPLAEQLQRDPALAAQFEEFQQFDRSVQAALADVEIPTGLADRILAAIEPSSAPLDAAANAAFVEAAHDAADPRPRGRTRRKLPWSIAISAALAACLLVAIFTWNRSSEAGLHSAKAVAARAMIWTSQLDDDNWQTEPFPLADFPAPVALRLPPHRWQRVDETRFPVVCYDLTMPNQPRIYLFVIQEDPGFRGALLPPLSPDHDTRNWCLGVWASDDGLYAVAVEGGRERYQWLIRATLQFA